MEVDPSLNPEQLYDEDGNPIPMEPQSNISEEVRQDMKNIWEVFDIEGKGQVDIKEMRTILKALDIRCDDEDILDEI